MASELRRVTSCNESIISSWKKIKKAPACDLLPQQAWNLQSSSVLLLSHTGRFTSAWWKVEILFWEQHMLMCRKSTLSMRILLQKAQLEFTCGSVRKDMTIPKLQVLFLITLVRGLHLPRQSSSLDRKVASRHPYSQKMGSGYQHIICKEERFRERFMSCWTTLRCSQHTIHN